MQRAEGESTKLKYLLNTLSWKTPKITANLTLYAICQVKIYVGEFVWYSSFNDGKHSKRLDLDPPFLGSPLKTATMI